MKLSRRLVYWPYKIAWKIHKLFNKKNEIHFFADGYVDYVIFKTVFRHFPDAKIVARNRQVKKELAEFGVDSIRYPTYPDVLVMPRHTASKFPEEKILKIGMRHGAYHFKDFVKAARYHMFDMFFVTSQHEVELAREKGILNTVNGGFPKLDPMFNGEIDREHLQEKFRELELNPQLPVVLFTATWDKSGMSAVSKWAGRLKQLTSDYNVLVTVHHWTDKKYINRIKKTVGVRYIKDKNVLPYLMLADVMVADMSSIIAEFCALDKPIITFEVDKQKRTSEEIVNMLKDMSVRVSTFDDLEPALKRSIENPDEFSEKRKKYNEIMFGRLDGKVGERMAQIINDVCNDRYKVKHYVAQK